MFLDAYSELLERTMIYIFMARDDQKGEREQKSNYKYTPTPSILTHSGQLPLGASD